MSLYPWQNELSIKFKRIMKFWNYTGKQIWPKFYAKKLPFLLIKKRSLHISQKSLGQKAQYTEEIDSMNWRHFLRRYIHQVMLTAVHPYRESHHWDLH